MEEPSCNKMGHKDGLRQQPVHDLSPNALVRVMRAVPHLRKRACTTVAFRDTQATGAQQRKVWAPKGSSGSNIVHHPRGLKNRVEGATFMARRTTLRFIPGAMRSRQSFRAPTCAQHTQNTEHTAFSEDTTCRVPLIRGAAAKQDVLGDAP